MSPEEIARDTCGTCAHHRPDYPAYPACAIVNIRSMWGQYALMPAAQDEGCFRHEERVRAAKDVGDGDA